MGKSETDRVIEELERCLATMLAYRVNPGNWYGSPTRAAAKRASLDTWRALARWRKWPTTDIKLPKGRES